MKTRLAKIIEKVEGTDPKARARFGEKLGRDAKLVSEWLNPKRTHKPGKIDIDKIEKEYNINPGYLLRGVGPMIKNQIDQHPPIVEHINYESLLMRAQNTISHYERQIETYSELIKSNTAMMQQQQNIIDRLSIALVNKSEPSSQDASQHLNTNQHDSDQGVHKLPRIKSQQTKHHNPAVH